MKTTVTRDTFIQAFKDYGRADNFSHRGLNALYDYFTESEQDTGEEIELDVIAICCEYSEDTIDNVLSNYNLESIDDLDDHTTVIYKDNDTVLYQEF